MSCDSYIRTLIQQEGPISIARFMQEALMHPILGYYQQKQPFGKDGDFITAPDISQIFGETIGAYFAHYWHSYHKDQPFHLVEIGPGRGTLMSDILRSTAHVHHMHACVDVKLVEQSHRLREVQKDTLASYSNIEWIDDISDLDDKPCLFVSNELLDALPIQQFKRIDGQWHELLVGFVNDDLGWIATPCVASVDKTLTLNHPDAKDGHIVELSSASHSLMLQLYTHIHRHGGAGIMIDYGYVEPTYQSTLQAIKDHKYHNPLHHIGQADITAHVDFGSLRNIACPIAHRQVLTQSEFLHACGAKERLAYLVKKNPEKQEMLTSGLTRLTDEKQMGELFKVLLASKEPLPL